MKSNTNLTNLFLIILFLIGCTASSVAQSGNQKTNSDPNKAKFVTSDVDNFWRAFDLAAKEDDRTKKSLFIRANISTKAANTVPYNLEFIISELMKNES